MRKLCLGFVMLWACCATLRAKPVALFYLTDNPDSIRSFLAHEAKIDLLVPTWYSVDENGLVTGAPNPTVLEAAHRDGLAVMPILALFGKKKFHDLSGNAAARSRMNDALVREAKLHGYTGFQFDFENLDYLDRDSLSSVVAETADALHKANLQITIATVPNAPGYPGQGGFAKWIYSDWRGAYDLAALAKSVDLICLMTYDQQTRWTMPGPVAGWQWTTDNLDYALKVVPSEKLSLGILSTAITGTPARPPPTKPAARRSPTSPATTSAHPMPCNLLLPTAASSSGTTPIAARFSTSIATRCANGSSSPICAPSANAISWYRTASCRASAPGSLAPKIPKSGRCSRNEKNNERVPHAWVTNSVAGAPPSARRQSRLRWEITDAHRTTSSTEEL